MDEKYLLAALEQASMGRGICAPNPSVGAVAVRDGEIIARAFHKGAGTPHAEVLVFEQYPKNLDGVTLYVTLEPCNHWGRTPPCVNAVIAQGVSRVVYGYRDPNPVVISNNTPSILAEHGIESRYLPLKEIDEFYQSYRHWRHTKKPFVSTAIKQNINETTFKADTKLSALHFFNLQRKNTDVVLTSAQSVNDYNPSLNACIEGVNYPKNIAILDENLQLNPEAHILKSSKKVLIYFDEGNEPVLHNSLITYYSIKKVNTLESLNQMISHLGELGYHDIWVEGDTELLSAIHQAQLVDRTYIYKIANQKGLKGEDLANIYMKGSLTQEKEALITWQNVGDETILCCDWRKC
ncbi:riboflavin biosynthesis protein RibD [Legionella birminghamensis]|uniref:Riboflavin biosynthesis protein RibD n=1 Tax=Legionella birminghamensis TaxID=28083 RepID=A0A378I9Y9_9GAMM|nr:bifunctional diaminohydroxyphosphoribosylaminopyrimidine deaminase/5-amino-6-(5-phosphoribosylamino)uracil reductase RibD [Legionella birminghamensis]KTC69359.1 riboflavin biosynthesis protein RibD [Legionella birminghamensis]STX31622.1 riboflavin biosynthesis protein [Legionella birminghamensis]